MKTGTTDTRLIILRGPSASGKTTVAGQLRHRYGRGLAMVGQDNLRRVVLRERDTAGAANIGLIDLTARYALEAGFVVVVEGILYVAHYGAMLQRLIADHRGLTRAYYFDIPFPVTVQRHATKPQAAEYGEAEMREWYRERDLLPGGIETVIGADCSQDQTVQQIWDDAGLARHTTAAAASK